MGEKLPLLSYLQLLQSMTLLILQLVMIYNGLYFYQAVFWHWEMMLAPWPSVPRFLYNNLSRQTFLKLNVNFLNNNCQRKRVKECKDEGNICLPCRCAWLDLGRFSYNYNCVYVSLFCLFFNFFFQSLFIYFPGISLLMWYCRVFMYVNLIQTPCLFQKQLQKGKELTSNFLTVVRLTLMHFLRLTANRSRNSPPTILLVARWRMKNFPRDCCSKKIWRDDKWGCDRVRRNCSSGGSSPWTILLLLPHWSVKIEDFFINILSAFHILINF